MSPAVPRPVLRVGVTELLARRAPSLFGFAGAAAHERLRLGGVLHGRYQRAAAAADPSFRGEVSLYRELEAGAFRVELRGRADGVRETRDGALRVEELKSHHPARPPSARLRETCRDQAAIYAWMLRATEEREVAAELVWLDLAGEEPPHREPVELDDAATEARVRAALAPFLRDAEREERERPLRRRAAAQVRFPHRIRRPGQERIAAAVEQALAAREHLLVEAPTGLGKTAAVLEPALRFALAEDRRIVLLTAKGTQRAGALATHARLGAGAAAPGLRLAAKPAMCANDVLRCHADHCRFARDHHEKVEREDAIARLLAGDAALGPEAVRGFAKGIEVCPHELARQAAARAALVVGDYNHLLEPAAALPAFAPGGDARDVILLLDEVHNLPERAREVFGARLDGSALRGAAERCGFGGAPVHRELEASLLAVAEWLEESVAEPCGEGADGAAEAEVDAEVFRARHERVEAALAARLAYGLETGSLDADDPAWECGFALRRFASALAAEGDRAFLAERRGGAPRLAALCLDPAPRLGRLLARCHAVVGLSATLTPLDFHRELLGLDPARTASLALPSPFPRENRRIVIDPRVGTRAGERAREAPRIARRLAALADAVPGHCLALFPSFALLEAIAGHLPPGSRTGRRLLVQEREGGERERGQLVAALRAPPDEPTLVLAVAGGVLAEGVDYGGGGLRAVAVVGPCVPPPDPERELLRRGYEERFDDGFACAYALPGMVRVVQAAGRLIRSAQDRGVIALLGRRFLEPPYRGALPEDWCDGDPERFVGDPARAAADFFSASRP